MAEFNFGLLTPPGSQSIGNAFVTGMNQAAASQQLENQNALARYTLAKARREDELTNKMLAGLQGANTIEEQARILRSVGKVKEANDLLASNLTQQKTRTDIGINIGNIIKKEATSVLASPTYETAKAALARVAAGTGQDMSSELARLEAIKDDPKEITKWAQGHALTGEQLLNANKPVSLAPGASLVDPNTNRVVYTAPRGPVSLAPGASLVDPNTNKPIIQASAINPATGLPEYSNVQTFAPGQATAPGQPPALGQASAPGQPTALGQAAAPGQPTIVPDEKTALALAIALDRAGMPVNVRVPGPDSRNALPGAEGVNALAGGALPSAAANPKQQLERFSSDLSLERQGFRRLPDGKLERISGGPADPDVVAAQEEGKNLAKLRADEYKELAKNAAAARKAIPAITTAERILESGFTTGWGTEAQSTAANILTSLGVPEAKQYATTAQTFLAQARQITNDRLLEQKGTQTENDFKRVEDIGAKLTNTVDANKFLLAVNRAINNQTIDKHRFFTRWETTHNTLKGAEQAWQDGPGNVSLFDRPELKSYAATQTPQKPVAAPRGGSSILDQADAIIRRGNR